MTTTTSIMTDPDLQKLAVVLIDENTHLVLTRDKKLVNTLQLHILKLKYVPRRKDFSSFTGEELKEEILYSGDYFSLSTTNVYEQSIIILDKYILAQKRLERLKKLGYAT